MNFLKKYLQFFFSTTDLILLISSYGYCLLDFTSTKNTSYTYLTRKQFNKQTNPGRRIANSNYFKIKKEKHTPNFKYCALEIGSTILWYSKKIFFDALYFILRCSDPRKLQYIYSGIYNVLSNFYFFHPLNY